jgi:hypothetical protein
MSVALSATMSAACGAPDHTQLSPRSDSSAAPEAELPEAAPVAAAPEVAADVPAGQAATPDNASAEPDRAASPLGEMLMLHDAVDWDAVPLRFPTPALAPFDARCGEEALTEIGTRALRRKPYLQNLDSNSVAILYKLEPDVTTGPPALEISTPRGSHVASVPVEVDVNASDGLQRVAHVKGLMPSTYYCYSLPGFTQRIGFQTAPPPGSAAPTRFVVIGDSGTGSPAQAAVRDRFSTLSFDFLLHAGDIAYTHGTLDQFEQFYFGMYEGLLKNIASFPVPGNHEYYTDNAAPFVEVFELPDNGVDGARDRWFSFDWGNVHFVGLDTERVATEQVEWLERDLTNNQQPWVVAYLHRPPFSSGHHGGAENVRDAFAPVFERHRVPLVLSGHEHNYERTVPINGVTYVVTGGGGRGLRSVGSSWFTAHSESAYHFVSIAIDTEAIDLRALDEDGHELDSVRITR